MDSAFCPRHFRDLTDRFSKARKCQLKINCPGHSAVKSVALGLSKMYKQCKQRNLPPGLRVCIACNQAITDEIGADDHYDVPSPTFETTEACSQVCEDTEILEIGDDSLSNDLISNLEICMG